MNIEQTLVDYVSNTHSYSSPMGKMPININEMIIEDTKQSVFSAMFLYMVKTTSSKSQRQVFIDLTVSKIRKKIITDFEKQCTEMNVDATNPIRETYIVTINKELKAAQEQLSEILS